MYTTQDQSISTLQFLVPNFSELSRSEQETITEEKSEEFLDKLIRQFCLSLNLEGLKHFESFLSESHDPETIFKKMKSLSPHFEDIVKKVIAEMS